MNAKDWGRHIDIPSSSYLLSPLQQKRYDEAMESMRNMGRTHHFFQRMTARECGLSVLPGTRVYVNGKLIINQPEDLTVFIDGEKEWLSQLCKKRHR